MTSHELSYATASTPPIRRWLIRAIENLSGRRGLLKIYYRWRAESAGGPRMWRDALDMIGTRLEINAAADWEARPAGWSAHHHRQPSVRHRRRRRHPVDRRAHRQAVPRPDQRRIHALAGSQALALPIDFNETKEALAANLKTRNEARQLLKDGASLSFFPLAAWRRRKSLSAKAEELPWKLFTARLVQQSGATVLPVYFEGQNSAFFHFVSRYSLSLRLALLVLEFRHHIGAAVRATIGPPVSWAEITASANGGSIIDELYMFGSSPGARP